MLIFLLSKLNLELSREEVLQLFDIKEYNLIDNLLFINKKVNEKLFFRLAYTKYIYEYLFEGTKNNILDKIRAFNWNKIYKENFCIRFHGLTKFKQIEFSDIIWKKLKEPKVELAVPETSIEFFFKDRIIVAKLVYENKEKFEERRAHLRPELSPISLDPRLARCLINLTGIEKGLILDPFCGVGGILIEAGLMKLNPIGYDIDKVTLQKCKINLTFFNIKAKLFNEDSLNIKEKYDYIVTDLPYGKSSKKTETLYKDFLNLLRKILKKKAVICFPNWVDKRLIKKNNLKIIKGFEYYIHKSLMKKIVLLE